MTETHPTIFGNPEPPAAAVPVTRMIAGAAAATMTMAAGAVFYFDPAKSNFFPTCPLYQLTGLACPGCGLTRGFHALSHGDIIPALDFNLLLPVWTVIFLWVLVSLLLLAVRGRGLEMWPTRPRFMYGFMAALLVFGVLRNIPAWPLTILFP